MVIFHSYVKLPEGIPTPLKNMSSSVGMMTFPTYGKILKKHVPNHQSDINGKSWKIPITSHNQQNPPIFQVLFCWLWWCSIATKQYKTSRMQTTHQRSSKVGAVCVYSPSPSLVRLPYRAWSLIYLYLEPNFPQMKSNEPSLQMDTNGAKVPSGKLT